MKLIGDTTCPHCKKDHEAEFNIDNIEPTKPQVPQGTVKQIISNNQTLLEPEIKTVEKIKEVVPSHIPKFKCKNGDCGQIHENPNYKRITKAQCTNCKQFTADIDSKCTWCGNTEFDEVTEEDLENMNIPLPTHDHEHD